MRHLRTRRAPTRPSRRDERPSNASDRSSIRRRFRRRARGRSPRHPVAHGTALRHRASLRHPPRPTPRFSSRHGAVFSHSNGYRRRRTRETYPSAIAPPLDAGVDRTLTPRPPVPMQAPARKPAAAPSPPTPEQRPPHIGCVPRCLHLETPSPFRVRTPPANDRVAPRVEPAAASDRFLAPCVPIETATLPKRNAQHLAPPKTMDMKVRRPPTPEPDAPNAHAETLPSRDPTHPISRVRRERRIGRTNGASRAPSPPSVRSSARSRRTLRPCPPAPRAFPAPQPRAPPPPNREVRRPRRRWNSSSPPRAWRRCPWWDARRCSSATPSSTASREPPSSSRTPRRRRTRSP